MCTQLFWFSGTGNSLELAKDIAKGLQDVELVSIPSTLGQEVLITAERVGFVFPVYAWGVPRIVVDFIKQLKFRGREYVFALVTCGGNPAGTLPQLAKLLEAKGVKLRAGFSIVQPDNYIPWGGAKAVEKQMELFKGKQERLLDIIDVIREKKDAPLEQNSAVVNFFLGQIYKLSMKHFPTGDKALWVNDKCNGCGQCIRICPRGNIKTANGRPEWQGNCEMCMACLQWCPTEAIQYQKNTAKRTRYRHPMVKASDLFLR